MNNSYNETDDASRFLGDISFAKSPIQKRDRGHSEGTRDRGISEHVIDHSIEEGRPFLVSKDDEDYDPKAWKPRNGPLYITRFDGIQRDSPKYSRGRRCPFGFVCRWGCALLTLIFGLIWIWILIERSRSNEIRAKLLSFLQEATIYPLSDGTLVETWKVHPFDDDTTCPLIFTLDSADAKRKGLNLLKEELELLGTLLVRVCKCACPVQHNTNLLSKTQVPCSESAEMLNEILRGANVVIDGDEGWFYTWFKQMQDAQARTSSHFSPLPMYGVPEGKLLRTVLTGVDVFRDSWFQLEGGKWSITKHPFESAVHAINYVEYIISGKQVGPLGRSRYTDSKPIRVSFDGCV